MVAVLQLIKINKAITVFSIVELIVVCLLGFLKKKPGNIFTCDKKKVELVVAIVEVVAKRFTTKCIVVYSGLETETMHY